MALNTTIFKNNIYSICSDMNSISENGDEYFCNRFAESFQTYLNDAYISTVIDVGTADGGAYSGSTIPNPTTGDNIGIKLKKIPNPENPLEMIYKLANDLKNHFLIEGGTDILYAGYIATDITTALSESTISCKTIGTVTTTYESHPQNCDGIGIFVGNPLIISTALITTFANMLSNAQAQTEGYDGNRDFSNSLGDIIYTFLTTGILNLTYARAAPPFACNSTALIS